MASLMHCNFFREVHLRKSTWESWSSSYRDFWSIFKVRILWKQSWKMDRDFQFNEKLLLYLFMRLRFLLNLNWNFKENLCESNNARSIHLRIKTNFRKNAQTFILTWCRVRMQRQRQRFSWIPSWQWRINS